LHLGRRKARIVISIPAAATLVVGGSAVLAGDTRSSRASGAGIQPARARSSRFVRAFRFRSRLDALRVIMTPSRSGGFHWNRTRNGTVVLS